MLVTGNSPVDRQSPDRLTVNAVDRAAVSDVLLMYGASCCGKAADS
jgi:hypothetical protein